MQSINNFKPNFSWLIKHPISFVAFGFGSGLAKKAPGTFGTIVGVLIAFILHNILSYFFISNFNQTIIFIILSVVFFVIGIPICSISEKEVGKEDYGGIVWDEIAAVFFITSFYLNSSLIWWVLIFIVFRIFDIIKPWPIKVIDSRLHGGIGIMLDDLIAAFFSIITLEIILFVTTKLNIFF